MPEISVIVPVYNTEKYLRRCIDSILAQAFTDFELILVDDGSTDASGAICDEYAGKDHRVRAIHQKNQGQATARNNAVKASLGKYISFVDADDMVHKNFLSVCFDAIQSTNASIACCRAFEGNKFSSTVFTPIDESFKYEIIKINDKTMSELFVSKEYLYGVVWGKVIKKSIILDNLFTPGRIFEDSALVCKWLCSNDYFVRVPLVLYFYQYNTEGSTHSEFSPKRLDILWSLQEQEAFFDKRGYELTVRNIKRQFVLSSAYCYSELIKQGEMNLAKQTRMDLIKNVCRDFKRIYLDKNDVKSVLSSMAPRVMEVYWTIQVINNHFRRFFSK